jgi:hypothetical protein
VQRGLHGNHRKNTLPVKSCFSVNTPPAAYYGIANKKVRGKEGLRETRLEWANPTEEIERSDGNGNNGHICWIDSLDESLHDVLRQRRKVTKMVCSGVTFVERASRSRHYPDGHYY